MASTERWPHLRIAIPISVPGKKSSVTRTVSNSSPLALCAVEKMMPAKRKTNTGCAQNKQEQDI